MCDRILVMHQGEIRGEVLKLVREYTSAEASGHFFFKVNSDEVFFDKKAVVDDGITSAFIYLHMAETLGEDEGVK